ncbi:unnamed protein product, partial [Symbiodinium microadriaticum]
AQTESSSLRAEVARQLAEVASLRAALGQKEVASKELESSKQQLVAEAQTEASSLREEVGTQLAELASLRAALCQSEAQTESSYQVDRQFEECASLRAALCQSEVLCTELESSKQQLAKQSAEAQAESSSLRDEVGKLLEECAALREMSSEVAKREQEGRAQAEDVDLLSRPCKVQTAVKLEERPLLGRRRSAKDYERRAAQVSLHHKHRKPAELKEPRPASSQHRRDVQFEVLCTELESSKQQLAKQSAEAQAESSSLHDEVGKLLEECAALRSEMSSEAAKTELREAEVLCTELESSKQQLAKQSAEAQAESSSLRDEVGKLLEECAALRSAMSSE